MKQVMRMIKIKRSGVYGIQLERQREKDDTRNFAYSDIDRERTDLNLHYHQTEHWNKAITSRLKEAGVKERKDSNVLMGAVFTASPDFFKRNPEYKEEPLGEDTRTAEQKKKWIFDQRTREYFDDCLRFYIKHQCGGDKSLILDATIDMDETTPHLQIYSIPLVKREAENGETVFALSAKEIFGNRIKLREYQNQLHAEIGLKYNFERGVQVEWDKPYEERRKHQKTRDYKQARDKAEVERLETELKELKREKLVKDEELDTLYHSLENLQQAIQNARDEYSQMEDNVEFVKKMNDDIDKLRSSCRRNMPTEYGTHKEKKNFLGKVIKPETVEYVKDDIRDLCRANPYSSRDSWDLNDLRRSIDRLYSRINKEDVEYLEKKLDDARIRENSLKKDTRQLTQELENIKYGINQLMKHYPSLEPVLKQVLEPPKRSRGQAYER